MSVELEKREIPIDPTGAVASSIADAFKTLRDDDGPRLQAIEGDIEGIKATVDVYPPQELLQAVRGALIYAAEHDDHRYDTDVPDEDTHWHVLSIDLAVDEIGTVVIEVESDE